MLKLNILNLKEFLSIVNSCEGDVYIIRPDGRKENIKQDYVIQEELWGQYGLHRNHLPLALEIPAPGDYLKIVNYYAGDC